MPGKPLIIDLGMHVGTDTEYYLARGYRVVGVEANPALALEVAERLQGAVACGDLTIVTAALSDRDGTAPFFLSPHTELSSLERSRVDLSGSATEIIVETVTLASLIRLFGNPHFIKCDIEGVDGIFCRDLGRLAVAPPYVSVEGIALEWLALLFAAGYRQFKLSNQAQFRRMMAPPTNFALDGEQKSWTFRDTTSGPFGEDVPGPWLSFAVVAQRWLDFERVKAADSSMVLDNWFDFHAKLHE